MKLLLLLALSIAFLIDSLLRGLRTAPNLGTALMYLITAALWVYTLFYRQIDAFCAHGPGRVLKILFLGGCAVFLCIAIFLSVASHGNKANGDEPVVIVLGAGLRGTTVSGLLARRLDAALAFYAEHPDALLVVTGGQGPNEAMPEAHAMRDYLLARDVPAAQILVEDKSTSTEENFRFAFALLKARGISPSQPIAFATNRFHCYRAGNYARQEGFSDVRALPATTGFSSLMPCYLREVFAVLFFWVFRR